MADTSESSSSTAARVFNVPELLENILVYVGKQDAYIGELQQYTPAVALFRLQRVNRFFLNTIQGSLKLRRLMWLEHVSSDTEERRYVLREEGHQESANLRPLWWLFEECGDRSRFIDQPDTSWEVVDLDTKLAEQKLPASMRAKEASWRQMTIIRAWSEHDETRVIVDAFQDRYRNPCVALAQFVRRKDEDTGRDVEYTAHLWLEDHQDLGDLWDCYEGILSRSTSEHRRGYREFTGYEPCIEVGFCVRYEPPNHQYIPGQMSDIADWWIEPEESRIRHRCICEDGDFCPGRERCERI